MSAKRVLVAKRPAVRSPGPMRSDCKCARSEDSLQFDCRDCAHGKDLNDIVCLKRVISALAEHQDVKEVVLSGDWESLYRDGCVRVLNQYADLVRTCRSGSPEAPHGEQCQSCPNDPKRLFATIAERLPMPWDDLKAGASASNVRPGCYSCVAATASVMTRLGSMAKELDRSMAKEAFRIVGVSD